MPISGPIPTLIDIHGIMQSAAIEKASKNLRSQHTTPHNAQLRIIGNTDIDPVARRVVVGALCLGDDADALGLQAQGHDFAVEFLAGFLERADDSHVISPCWFRAPRPPRPQWRSES